jgi:Iap family predicted aminopeptidase
MPGQEFMPDPSCPTVLGTFKPVYINRKEINDRMVLMDRLRDAKETFLVVDNSSKEGETPEMTKRINDLIEKMKTDPQVQLKGLIIHNPGKVAWSTSSTQGIRPVIYVSKEAADFSVAKEIKIAVDAEYKSHYETQNVVGMIKGTAKPDSFIVVSAHYDHLGTMGSSTIYPGANNSASGVAMMLSLAKHYSIVPPKYSVIFVAFAGSELGFAGAQAFVSSPPYKLDQIKYDFNFDLEGNGIEGIKVVNGAKFEDQIKQMNKINAYYKLLPKVEPAPTRRISDHCVFDEKAIPSMFIYTLGGTVAYHNLNDTPANLPFTKFANFLNLMIRYLETIK